MVTESDEMGFRGGNLWGRCHSLYMRSTNSMPMSHVSQHSYAAREEARHLEASTGQGNVDALLKHLERLESAVEMVRAHLLSIQAAAEELRRDIEIARPQSAGSQVWADAYRNVVASRPRRPE
jgi:hypothetical protein